MCGSTAPALDMEMDFWGLQESSEQVFLCLIDGDEEARPSCD